MSSLGQDERIAAITASKLGDDTLFLTRFSGSEGMSKLFEFRVEALSENPEIDFDPQLGQDLTVTYKTKGHGDRQFTGTCVEAVRLGKSIEGYVYVLTLRPEIWLLSKRRNSRVFQKMTVREVIEKLLSEHGIAPDIRLQSSFPKLEYCVQHRETDLDFLLRLMEGSGISFHFEFKDNKQKLMLTDFASYVSIAGDKRSYSDADNRNTDVELLYRWMPQRRFTTNKATLTDRKLQQIASDNYADFTGDAGFKPSFEDYYHPYHQHTGEETAPDQGLLYAEVRVGAERGTDRHFLSGGDCGSFTPGYKVTLENHPTDDGEYLIVGCRHSINAQAYRSSGGDEESPYIGEYELTKAVRFVPPIVTPKPLISGPQTGVVVGDNTEGNPNSIATDKYGRVKVHMHWNRDDPGKAEGQTMWCRVAQVWTGQRSQWGAIFIPRIGTEVLVEFLDGDPDRPVVTGCVYNSSNMPPYGLPGNEFMAGWKSNFEDKSGYNEIVMIDSRGKEQLRFHTDKDLLTEVKNDETRQVDNNRKTKIAVDDTHDVGKVLTVTAGTKIVLSVQSSSITLEPTKITISAPTISIQASAKLQTNGAAMAEHTAGGNMTIKGAIVMIN